VLANKSRTRANDGGFNKLYRVGRICKLVLDCRALKEGEIGRRRHEGSMIDAARLIQLSLLLPI